MNKTIQQKRLEFLEEMVEYYSENTNRRCVSESGNCYYNPVAAKKQNISEGCAIGRKIPRELQEELDKLGGVSNNEVFEKLPVELQKLSQNFLTKIQNLHDYSINWNKLGISERGVEEVNDIKAVFCS